MRFTTASLKSVRYDAAQALILLEEIVQGLTPRKRKITVSASAKTMKRHKAAMTKAYHGKGTFLTAMRKGSHKTARMLVVLADGKRHSAKELALAGNVTSGHVHTHLAGRVAKGEIKRVAKGTFQLTRRVRKAA
jgi:hypothetical protein